MPSRKFRGGGGDIQATQRNLERARLEIIQTLGKDALTAKGDISKQFANIPIAKKYAETQTLAQQVGVTHNIENDIYNHLLTFFGSYYQDGDFVPQRQITNRSVYSLPYNGEDVYLHWANRGQYYIKTAEYFHSYAFVANNVKARFFVCEAQDTPQNNNKGASRFFFPQIADSIWNPKNKELQIPLQHRTPTPKDKLSRINVQQNIITDACDTAKTFFAKKIPSAVALLKKIENGEDSYLFSHLMKYTRRNDSDFFIHKDLESFLKRELHSTIKSKIINLDEIGGSSGLARAKTQLLLARTVQDIGEQIISHLAQLENFQKALWEKKKFITKTNYIAHLGVVLNNANTQMQKNICTTICKTNAQWNEWENLGVLQTAKNVFDKDAEKCAAARQDFINKNFSLPLDTSHFESDFCNLVLSCFDNVEEATDGILIHGENWQALNLLEGKYREQIKCVYIDPPYNTGNDGFLYKDSYEHSSWMSMISDRLIAARNLMCNDGVLFSSIGDLKPNDGESVHLQYLTSDIFPKRFGNLIWRKRGGIGSFSEQNMTENHEYILVHGNSEGHIHKNIMSPTRAKEFIHSDERGKYRWMNIVGPAQQTKQRRPNLNYTVIYDSGYDKIVGFKYNIDGKNQVSYFDEKRSDKLDDINLGGEATWLFGKDIMEKFWQKGILHVVPSEDSGGLLKIQIRNYLYDDNGFINGSILKSVLSDNQMKIGMNTEGSKTLKDLFYPVDYSALKPKPVSLINFLISTVTIQNELLMDFFAGSGTTAHAVINLNREDGGRRKFILVEMGDYFDDVLMKRIKKIIYTPDWKNGKPNRDTTGDLHDANVDNEPRLIKYHCMESYEDALDNIEFAGEETLFDGDYESRYMLQWESKESATFAPGGKLDSPFDYTLKRAGKQKKAVADLPETFNYMAGVRLRSRHIEKNDKTNYQIDIGDYGDEDAAFIWRDIAKWTQVDYEKERDFIATLKILRGKKIYTNGSSKIRGALSLSPIFVKRMFAEAE